MKLIGVCILTVDVIRLTEFYEFALKEKAEGDEIHMSFNQSQLVIYNPGNLSINDDKNMAIMYFVNDVEKEFQRLKNSKYDINFFMNHIKSHGECFLLSLNI